MARPTSVDRELAALGARVKIAQLEEEIADLKRRFPVAARGSAVASAPARRRRVMSAAEKKAVSVRMKKYWAERRKAKG